MLNSSSNLAARACARVASFSLVDKLLYALPDAGCNSFANAGGRVNPIKWLDHQSNENG